MGVEGRWEWHNLLHYWVSLTVEVHDVHLEFDHSLRLVLWPFSEVTHFLFIWLEGDDSALILLLQKLHFFSIFVIDVCFVQLGHLVHLLQTAHPDTSRESVIDAWLHNVLFFSLFIDRLLLDAEARDLWGRLRINKDYASILDILLLFPRSMVGWGTRSDFVLLCSLQILWHSLL